MTPPPMTASDPESGGIFAPFAGMIRIRCDGKGRFGVPTLSPRARDSRVDFPR